MNAKLDTNALKLRIAQVNAQKPQAGGEIKFDFDDLEKTGVDWETSARATVIRMFTEAKFEENFTFKVAPGEADHYINAMRSVLARVRKKAMKEKKKLDEFKLLVVGIKHEPTHDVVTLVRTRATSQKAKSIYDDLVGFVTAESEEK